MGWQEKFRFNFSISLQVAFCMVMLVFLYNLSSMTMEPRAAILRSIAVFACHLTNFYVVFSWLTPRYFEREKYTVFVLSVIVFLLLLSPLRWSLENSFARQSPVYLARKNVYGLVLFSELAITAFAFLLRLVVSAGHFRRKMAETEKLHLETELRFLKSQMSPHFLFNTINNVYALTLIKSDKAPEALLRLSGLLRYTLYECNQEVPLQKEVDALKGYIALFQLRYEQPVNIRFEAQEENETARVEPLLLMPLLENAIKHSAIGVQPGAFVTMTIREAAHRLEATVRNSKSALPVAETDAGGIGLQNIRRRLQSLPPGKAALTIHEKENEFEVNLNIELS